MKNIGRIVGHIPARGGSKRVPIKNLRMINGKPLLQYAVESAMVSGVFDDVVVNTDNEDIAQLARDLGANIYMRDPELASDEASGDDFNYDFILRTRTDTLVMVSPVCPLIEPSDIRNAFECYEQDEDIDTLITVHTTQMQVFHENVPININLGGKLSPTQKNTKVNILNWAVTIWDAKLYVERYKSGADAYIGRNRKLFPIDPIKSVKISTEEDFKMAEILLKTKNDSNIAENPIYWNNLLNK